MQTLIEVGSTNANQYLLYTKHRSCESNALATYPPMDALESDPMMTPPLYFTARMVVCGREQRNCLSSSTHKQTYNIRQYSKFSVMLTFETCSSQSMCVRVVLL